MWLLFVGLKQPLYVFKKPSDGAVLPLSTSQSLVSVQSAGLSMVVCSTHGTPDCMSSCCWLTPRFEVGSTSCSTTPCSTRCQNTPSAADDVTNAASPCSSSSSSSSSSSGSGDRLRTAPTELSAGYGDASADVQPCVVCSESRTSASATVCDSDELLSSMHRHTAQCTCPRVTDDLEQLHTRSPS